MQESLKDDCDNDHTNTTVKVTKSESKSDYKKSDKYHLHKRHLGEEEEKENPTVDIYKEPMSDIFVKDGKLCRYKTVTKTVCKPTNVVL